MFNVGISEIFIILIGIFLLARPKDVPYIMHHLGSFFGKFKVYINDLQSDIKDLSGGFNIDDYKDELDINSYKQQNNNDKSE